LIDQTKPHKILDCIGLYCPEPVYQTRLEIDKLGVGQILEVIADDPAAEADIKSLVQKLGNCHLLAIRKVADQIHFVIEKKQEEPKT
jgi:tRNA 2-thiouridine synthesizing protein A